jgi:hypothetical protein
VSLEFPESGYTPSDTENFELLPPDEYVAEAIEGSIAPPKSGNGMQLTLTWKIIEGEHEGRRLWQNICFLHPKAGAQFHGQKMLNSIIAAAGAATPLKNVEPLLFVPVRRGIAIEVDKIGAYPDKNRVVKVSPLDSEATEATQAKPAPKPAPSPPSTAARPAPAGTAPWRK